MGAHSLLTRLNRATGAGFPMDKWQFISPEERTAMRDRATKAAALKRDTGKADLRLRKF